MKTNKIFSAVMVAVAMFSATAITSCNKDDNEYVAPSSKTSQATEVYSEPDVYVTDNMLQDFDIVATIDGEKVQLTTANTVPTSYAQKYDYFSDGSYERQTKSYPVRKFTTGKKTFKNFPASQKISVTATVKNGVDLAKKYGNNTYDYCLFAQFERSNNGVGFSGSISPKAIHFRTVKWDDSTVAKYKSKTYTATITFDNASKEEMYQGLSK